MPSEASVNSIGALVDANRRRLYDYVSKQQNPVSREEAAKALSLPLTRAKFHLDRLVEAGLLETEYRRLSGKQGPGAGRPSKLYRRASGTIEVSLPARRYDVMGRILAAAVEQAASGGDLEAAIRAASYAQGAAAVTPSNTATSSPEAQLEVAGEVLARLGYEPEVTEHSVRLRNCPFDTLAQDHRGVVCAANVHYTQGAFDAAGCQGVSAHLEPEEGYCCVKARLDPPPSD
ncbi:helix-turn-helix transcriptional regulator [Leucobacter denitrificans]|uniref:Helix-turn-helix domain-containing protein n=1 Tax=Leucobacter denitrificans TaxID=683042 RepID=A0A7G9S2Z7_9MICO|nr:helix-turn-helix domain-containing protein [Leucobacter denitrificans]QNN62222.1 helix-turn-helix domain-containing protein [Leucobacter denitrificans]